MRSTVSHFCPSVHFDAPADRRPVLFRVAFTTTVMSDHDESVRTEDQSGTQDQTRTEDHEEVPSDHDGSGDQAAVEKKSKAGVKKAGEKKEKKLVRLNKDGKRRKKTNYDSYGSYIHKVLKQVHPDIGITGKSINIMDCFVKDFFDKISSQAADLLKHSKKATIMANDIEAATRLVLPGELSKHAVTEGTKALAKYKSTLPPPKPRKKKEKAAAIEDDE